MIYCVIPRELADDLYDKMVEYYKDNPNVTVIVDRREGPDRRSGQDGSETALAALRAALDHAQRLLMSGKGLGLRLVQLGEVVRLIR